MYILYTDPSTTSERLTFWGRGTAPLRGLTLKKNPLEQHRDADRLTRAKVGWVWGGGQETDSSNTCPKVPCTPYFKTLAPKTIPGRFLPTRVFTAKYYVVI